MSNVIITGATGFVGSNLKPYLRKKDYSLIEISRLAKKEIVSYETCDVDLFNTSEAIIHLAGKAHDLKKVASDKDYYKANTELTINLYNIFLESSCKVFIFISSVKAASDSVEGILEENHTPTPKTVYGKSKLKAEQYILNNLKEDKRVYILRPCMIHGPNNKGNLNLLYKLIEKGIPYPLGDFQNKRSFLSVNNLCFVIEQLIQKTPNTGIYNVADDKAISTNELVKIIAKVLDKKSRIINVPKSFIKIMVKIGDVFRSPFNSEKLNKLTENFIVSNSKIKKALNLELPLTTEQGLTDTIKSFKNLKND